MSKKNELQTIDPTALAQVSGGARTTTSTSADDATLTALAGIQDSLTSLANQNSGGGGFSNEMLLIMMMMMNRNSQPTVVQSAPASPWGPPGGYWVVPR